MAVPAVFDVFGVDCLAEGVRTTPAIFTKACLVAGAKMMLIQRGFFVTISNCLVDLFLKRWALSFFTPGSRLED